MSWHMHAHIDAEKKRETYFLQSPPQAPAPSVQTDGAKTTPEVIHVEDAALLPEEEAHSIASSDV